MLLSAISIRHVRFRQFAPLFMGSNAFKSRSLLAFIQSCSPVGYHIRIGPIYSPCFDFVVNYSHSWVYFIFFFFCSSIYHSDRMYLIWFLFFAITTARVKWSKSHQEYKIKIKKKNSNVKTVRGWKNGREKTTRRSKKLCKYKQSARNIFRVCE